MREDDPEGNLEDDDLKAIDSFELWDSNIYLKVYWKSKPDKSTRKPSFILSKDLWFKYPTELIDFYHSKVIFEAAKKKRRS